MFSRLPSGSRGIERVGGEGSAAKGAPENRTVTKHNSALA